MATVLSLTRVNDPSALGVYLIVVLSFRRVMVFLVRSIMAGKVGVSFDPPVEKLMVTVEESSMMIVMFILSFV